MIKSLRKKFVLVAMLSTFAVLAAIMGTVNVFQYMRVLNRADNMTELLAQNDGKFPGNFRDREPGSTPESTPEQGGRNSADTAGKKPEHLPGFIKADVFSAETPYETRFFSVTLDENQEVISSSTEYIAAVDEEAAKEYAVRAAEEKNTVGFTGIYRYRTVEAQDGIRYIFLDCRRELTGFQNILYLTVSVSALGLAAVFVLVMFFSRLVFRPVEESLVKQKRFITDASHELKTPLTIIDANTEVMEMESGESQWTKSTKKQIQRLTVLTQQLVTLSRLDEERDGEEKLEFCLSDAVADSIQSFEAPVKAQGKQLELQIEEGISYHGNEKSIRQMLGILMDNAVKYSSEGGRIQITLARKGRKICLEVFNDAEELPQGRLDVLFERFYRLDTSRNSETGGSGIGLSVAKAIVHSHKGKINAFSSDGKSLTVTVTF